MIFTHISDVPYRKSTEGVSQPPFGGRVTKNTSGVQGLGDNLIA